MSNNTSRNPGASSDSSNGCVDNFPSRLHYMLSEIEKDGLHHIVSWQPHGRCFLVHEQKNFEEKILPFWFRQSKVASFQRQLNLYGFKRITTGHDKNSYYHPLFLRGKASMAKAIQRTRIKGEGRRKPSKPELEPNFYLMPFLTSDGVDEKKDEQYLNNSRTNNAVTAPSLLQGLGMPGGISNTFTEPFTDQFLPTRPVVPFVVGYDSSSSNDASSTVFPDLLQSLKRQQLSAILSASLYTTAPPVAGQADIAFQMSANNINTSHRSFVPLTSTTLSSQDILQLSHDGTSGLQLPEELRIDGDFVDYIRRFRFNA